MLQKLRQLLQNSPAFRLVGSKAIGALEFITQFGGLEVFAQMGDALLHGQQGFADRFLIGVGNVAPHGIGTGSEPRHFSEGPASDGSEIGRVPETVLQHGAQGGG